MCEFRVLVICLCWIYTYRWIKIQCLYTGFPRASGQFALERRTGVLHTCIRISPTRMDFVWTLVSGTGSTIPSMLYSKSTLCRSGCSCLGWGMYNFLTDCVARCWKLADLVLPLIFHCCSLMLRISAQLSLEKRSLLLLADLTRKRTKYVAREQR
jgi:hypothetical protein